MSQIGQHRDTFSGVDILDEQVKAFTGVVRSVEDNGEAFPKERRWRISIDVD
jgi:hypothetical protein